MIGHFDIVSKLFLRAAPAMGTGGERPALQIFTGKLAKSKANLSRYLRCMLHCTSAVRAGQPHAKSGTPHLNVC
jgi:hypothetical protein